MKKYYLYLTLSVLTSCSSDFLEEKPKSELTTDIYFSAPDHARSAVNTLYKDGVANFYHGTNTYRASNIFLGGYMSGLFNSEYKGQEVHVQHAQNLTLNGDNIATYLDRIWLACYEAISRANFAIENIPDTPDLEDDERKSLLAQARFFRAYNYFYLVKQFGDVPFSINTYKTAEDIDYLERTPSLEIYNQIIKDLEYARDQGGFDYEPMPENGFRISKGSVQTLLADVYLNMSGYPILENKYAEAATAAREVIGSGSFDLIEHGDLTDSLGNSAYNTMRTSDNEKEYVYVAEYNAEFSDNGAIFAFCYPNEASTWGPIKYVRVFNAYQPAEELLWVYDPDDDLRIQNKQFFHNSLTYIENDVEITRNFAVTPYLWHDDKAVFETSRSGKDVAVYRYPEVLLIAAEAIARTEGVTPEAVAYLADVRSRAYWQASKADIIASITGLSADDFVKEVWTERVRELVLDSKLWSDIQRTRKFPVTSEDSKGSVSYVDVIGHSNVWGKVFTEEHLLFPISETERQRNPNLTQNPGY